MKIVKVSAIPMSAPVPEEKRHCPFLICLRGCNGQVVEAADLRNLSHLLLPEKRHTLCANVFHFCYCRGIYRYALQIRFAPLSRGAAEDMNLNTGLHRVALTDLVRSFARRNRRSSSTIWRSIIRPRRV